MTNQDSDSQRPTIFHITHWKAGSQWLNKILRELTPDRIVAPQIDEAQFLKTPILSGAVYPTLYVSKEQFFSVSLPANYKKFVVLRDLRDTLVSGYFSIRYSHPIIDSRLENWRERLNSMSIESGLLMLMDEWLPACALIQESWVASNEKIIRYEDLLANDWEILETLLIRDCQFPVSRATLRDVVERNRFEHMSGGRKPGEEELTAHERKGIAGDWENHFTERVTDTFNERYGKLLSDSGYANNSGARTTTRELEKHQVPILLAEQSWPAEEAFQEIANVTQICEGGARCAAFAICNEHGASTRFFVQGEEIHCFYEFEIGNEIDIPSGGLEFHTSGGLVVYGKSSFQFDQELPRSVSPGERLRYHQVINLDIAPGEYWITLGLASTDQVSYQKYTTGEIGYRQFEQATKEHCRAIDIGSFAVQLEGNGKLRHHGITNLQGDASWRLISSVAVNTESISEHEPKEKAAHPTVIHVTHWKAGSQWIHKILNACAPDEIIVPRIDQAQFLYWPFQRGKIYPTVYVDKTQFDGRAIPADTRHFVVIRDLRDTLVSGYFSMKVSHPNDEGELDPLRAKLQSLDQEQGFLYMLDNWLGPCATIQRTWLEAGEPLVRYEDLLEHDLEILETILIGQCQLPIDPERLREAILDCRFESLSNGRARGDEDMQAHERKGIAGDWQNHFTPAIKSAFKNRYGGLLVATGYERDLNW
jgi:lipopolysaccharide transport system ATP-binding protein